MHPGVSKNTISIRSARVKDCRAVLELWTRSGIRFNPSDEMSSIQNRLRRDRDLFLVALDKSRLVGTLIAGWDGWRGTMARLAVDPAHRRLGIAQRLVAAAEINLRKRGARRIGALVFTDNDSAGRFWQSVGYSPESNIRRFVKNLPAKRR
jgi:ribosomal protein S18 acetylase RimI-like enzyme